jgi:hypothetical protein
MQLKQTIILLVFVIFWGPGCIKKIDVETRYEKPILVVEGAISTDTVAYTVALTYTRPVTPGNKIPDEYLEKNATVSIVDDQANATILSYTGDGIYTTTDRNYIGKVGRSYSVNIVLKNGKKYTSVPEKIPPAVPVDKASIEFDPRFNFDIPTTFKVYIDVSDPADQENYYKWVFASYLPRKTNGVPCGGFCVFGEYCYQRITNTDLQVYADAAINGNKIKNRLVGISPIYWYGDHYIDIMQYSISRDDYQFAVKLNEQQTRTGSILDPLPATIKGNVRNAADENDAALGYFSASSVTHKLVTLVPYNITQYQLDMSAQIFVPDGPHICFEYFPDALPYLRPPARQNPPPPGWSNAEIIEVHW